MKEIPIPPEGYALFTGEYNWQKLPKGSLMNVDGKWEGLSTHALCAIPGRSTLYAIPEGGIVEGSDVADLKLPHESILQEAERLVNGDRHQDYGTATESFGRIAAMWSAYKDWEITPKDVACMMILMKVSRSVTSTKRDNWTDIAGYAELGSQIEKQS